MGATVKNVELWIENYEKSAILLVVWPGNLTFRVLCAAILPTRLLIFHIFRSITQHFYSVFGICATLSYSFPAYSDE